MNINLCPDYLEAKLKVTEYGVGIVFVPIKNGHQDPILSELGEHFGDSIHPIPQSTIYTIL